MKKAMRWVGGMMVAVGLLVAAATVWAATVAPTVVSNVAFYRSQTANIPGSFAPGETIVFTNCVLYAGSDTSTVQSLAGVTGTVTFASTGNVDAVFGVATAASGVGGFTYTIPTNARSLRMQVRITDGVTTYYYPPCGLSMVEVL